MSLGREVRPPWTHGSVWRHRTGAAMLALSVPLGGWERLAFGSLRFATERFAERAVPGSSPGGSSET